MFFRAVREIRSFGPAFNTASVFPHETWPAHGLGGYIIIKTAALSLAAAVFAFGGPSIYSKFGNNK